LPSFETERPAEEGNFAALARINRELTGRVEAIVSPERVVLDMDSTGIPVYGEQERSAYNGHFESTCYHPLLVFHREGDCLAVKLRPRNVHSAEGGEELRLPEMDRQQKQGKQAVFRSGPRGRPGVAGAGRIAGAKAAATKAGGSRFELLECGRMGRCP